MSFNVTFDATASAQQQAAVQAVANFFNAHFTDPISIDINVTFANLGPNGLGQSNTTNNTYTFAAMTAALTADSTSTADATAVASLPGTDPITDPPGTTHTWTITQAEQMALGLIANNGATNDGTATFSNTATFDYDRTDGITAGSYDFFGVVAHEFTEIMGRQLNAIGNTVAFGAGYHPLDLFKFSAANTRDFVGTNAGYFSIDSGTTNLNNFNTATNGDFGDWAASAGNDAFRAFSPQSAVNLTTLADLTLMDVIGWQVVETAPKVAALTASVGEDGPSLSQNLLAGASDAENDPLFLLNLDTSVATVGTSSLAPTLFLNSDYTSSGSTIALTADGFAKFNGLSLGESCTASFGFDVCDGITSTHNTFTLTINGLNDPPIANPDTGSAGENETKLFDVLANDTDVDVSDTLSLLSIGSVTVSSSNPAINGLVLSTSVFTIDSGQIKFSPGTSFDPLAVGDSATVVVNYTMQDNHFATASSDLTLTVAGANDPPVANPDTGSAGENETKSFDVLANDTDVDFGDTLSLLSLGSVTVSSSNPLINGLALPASVFTIDSGQIKFSPGTSFDPLAVGDTATVVVDYTMQDNHSATASSDLTLTVIGENDPPVIVSGGGGDSATYFVRVNEQAITKVVATDVDVGDVDTFSIVGGADAFRFSIDANTGELVFNSHPNPPNKAYAVQVQASDGHGGTDVQNITVKVSADQMTGDAAHAVADTFVFHPKFGANTVTNFDLDHDFLQFDKGMFAADTAAAVLFGAHDTKQGNVIIDTHAGHLEVDGVTVAQLQAHQGDFLFV